MDVFPLDEVEAARGALGRPYHQFVTVPALSCGIYVLPAGGEDRQTPHQEDEVYIVMRGRAMVRIGEEDGAVGPGDTIFVAAQVPHRFHSIEEELVLLVAFGPAHTT